MSMLLGDRVVEFLSANKIVFGLGAVSTLAEEVKALGGTKVQVISDRILVEQDVIRPVLASLEQASIPYVVFDEVLPDAPVSMILKALNQYESEGCDLVIGFGGGSPMDTAKAVSITATNGTNLEELMGFHAVKKRGAPKITIPTTNAAGADVGFAIVFVTDEETHEHGLIACRQAMPDVVINDPMLTVSMPRSVTADTGIDVLVTGIEALASKQATPFSDLYAEKVISICAAYLPRVCAKGSDIEGRYHMALAATMSGLAYMSSMLGAVHGLSYPIAGACNLTHGRSMAPLLPNVMRFNAPGNPEAYARTAELMGYDTEGLTILEAAELAAEAVEALLDTIDVSYRLQDYGVQEGDIDKLAEEGMASMEELGDAFLTPNPRDMTLDDIKRILQEAFKSIYI